MRRTLSLWAPVVAWMLVIFVASSRSRIPYQDDVPDWFSHSTEYLVLSVLVSRAISVGGSLSLRLAAAVFAFGVAYGVFDEWHQSFVPGRHSDAWDVAKDALGTLIGLLAYETFWRMLRSREVRSS